MATPATTTTMMQQPVAPELPQAVSVAHAESMQWEAEEVALIERAAQGDDASSSTAAADASASVAPLAALAARAPEHVAGLRVSQLDALSLDAELGWMDLWPSGYHKR